MSMPNLLNSFITYIQTGQESDLNDSLSYYNFRHAVLRQDFYTTKLTQDNDAKILVKNLLDALDVPEYLRGRYINASLTVNDLLVELKQLHLPKNNRLQHITNAIKKKNDSLNVAIATSCAIASCGMWLLLPFLTQASVMNILKSIMTATFFFPVIGILFTLGVGLYSFIQGLLTPEIPLWRRFTNNFFLLAQTALNVAAYGSLIAATAAMTPIAASLFILAAAVSFIKEMTGLVEIFSQYMRLKSLPDTDELLPEVQKKIRLNYQFQTQKNQFLIELSASVVVAGTIALWCLLPTSLLISVVAIVAIGTVMLATKQMADWNKAYMRVQLAEQFSSAEEKWIKASTVQTVLHHQSQERPHNTTRGQRFFDKKIVTKNANIKSDQAEIASNEPPENGSSSNHYATP